MMIAADSKESLCNQQLLPPLQAEIALSTTLLLDRGNTKRITVRPQSINRRSVTAWFGMLAPSWDMPRWRGTVKGCTSRLHKRCFCSRLLRHSLWSRWRYATFTLGKLTRLAISRWAKLRSIMSMMSTQLSTERLCITFLGDLIYAVMQL
jgi:hypothetical protein